MNEHQDLHSDVPSVEDDSLMMGRAVVGGIFFLEDKRVRLMAHLGTGAEGKVFLGKILDGPSAGSLVVFKYFNAELHYISSNLVRAHQLRNTNLKDIPDTQVARFLAPPFGSTAFFTYVEGEDMARSLGSTHRSLPERLAMTSRWFCSALPTLAAMHKKGVYHGDVCDRNWVCARFTTTLVDIGNLTPFEASILPHFRPLNSHPDLRRDGSRIRARPKYDAYAAGMTVLTAPVPSSFRSLYIGRYSEKGHDWKEVQQAKVDGRFVHLFPKQPGQLEKHAAFVVNTMDSSLGDSDRQEAVERLLRHFQLGCALIGPDATVQAAALEHPEVYLRPKRPKS